MRYWPLGKLSFLVLALTISTVSATDPSDEPASADNVIRIGATFPRSGPLDDYGLSAYYGANTCVRMINANGGINGKKLEILWRDNRGDGEQAAEDIRELVEEHQVAAILGPLMSEATMSVRHLVDELEVVALSPMATIDAATADTEWVFRAVFTNTVVANALADFQIEKYGAQTCGIIYDSRSSFSTEMVGIFRDTFIKKGGDIVGAWSFIDGNGEKDYKRALEGIAGQKPDFLFVPCFAREAVEIIHAARDLGITTRFCAPYSWDNQVVFEGAGTRLAGCAMASSLMDQNFSRQSRIFFQAMSEAGMEYPDSPAACAYDAVMLLAKALENGEEPREIREGLLGINRMMLASGRTTINSNGDAIKPVIIRVVERNGNRMTPVYAERYDPPAF